MRKVFGIEAEVNLTADDEICKGIGKSLQKGSIKLDEIFKEIKPELIKSIKKLFLENKETKENKKGE